MFRRIIKPFTALFFSGLLLAACGDTPVPPAPTGMALEIGESSASVTWDMQPGVEYWLWYAPKSVAPTTTDLSRGWAGLPGGNVMTRVSSPATAVDLTNGLEYVFTLNAHKDGGPGGPGAAFITATPRLAGATWSTVTTPLNSAARLRAAVFGTVYVSAGEAGALITSGDGTTWTTGNSSTSNNLNAVAYVSDYRIVGDNGTIITSADAITWAAQTSVTAENLYGIATNSAGFSVAVGAKGTIITSADGSNWTKVASSGTSRDLNAVVYSTINNGLWLAVGAAGTMLKSPDAITWTPVATPVAGTDLSGVDLRSASFGVLPLATGQLIGTNALVVVGSAGTLLSSNDGSTWSVRTPPSVAANGTALSLSGVRWNSVVYGSQFIAAGTAGNIITSTDGITWSAASVPSTATQDLAKVARGSLSYWAVGATANVLRSK